MEIDPKLIDVELEYAGWDQSEEDLSFGTDFPPDMYVARDEWKDRIADRIERNHSLAQFHPYIYNQHPESSCVYNSAAACLTIRRNIQLGIAKQVILSPMSGYCRVARHRHSGSTMWGAMLQTTEYGLLPSDKHAEEYPHTFHENTPFVWPGQLPEGWEETAKDFRCLEWCRVRSSLHFASALLNDWPICYGRNGHSIVAEDLYWDDRNQRFLVSYCDSYGPERGQNGRLWDTERNWGVTGAWACRQVTMPEEIA